MGQGQTGKLAGRPLRVASLGGGTGQPALIGALRLIERPLAIEAVVAMGDDGRSSGILRDQEGMLPPGDLRKCLVALAADPSSPLARAFEHRFSWLDDHALGNLLITALADEGLSFADAIRACEELLGCVGHVHPSTLDPVRLAGRTAGGEEVWGQAALSYGSGRLDHVRLVPADAEAHGPAVQAVLKADLVVMGPGSLFTSLMPNLMVPGIAAALRATSATRLFVCPKADVPGECEGMDAEDYMDALERQGFADLFDVALFHRTDPQARPGFVMLDVSAARFPDVGLSPEAERRLCGRVPQVMVRDLADARAATAHDLRRLAGALEEVMAACRSARR